MPITCNESGNLGYYWGETSFIETVNVGNCSPFFGRPGQGGDDAALSCQLCKIKGEVDTDDDNTFITQGPEQVQYICVVCPGNPPVEVCVCCVWPPKVWECKTPDVESEYMFHMLFDTSDHGRWWRECCGGPELPLTIAETNITSDSDDEEIHIVGSNSGAAICFRYPGGTPNPEDTPRQTLAEGDTIGGSTITKLYHYSSYNNVRNGEDLNYHYAELSPPLTGKNYNDSVATNRGGSVNLISGAGIKDKCIIFGRFEFIKKEVWYSKLAADPALDVSNRYPVNQKTKKKIRKISPTTAVDNYEMELIGGVVAQRPELSNVYDPTGREDLVGESSLSEAQASHRAKTTITQDVTRSQERWAKNYQTITDAANIGIENPQNTEKVLYKRAVEGSEDDVLTTRLEFSKEGGAISSLELTDAGSGYGAPPVVTITSSGDGEGAAATVLGAAPLASMTVTTNGVGYQHTNRPVISANYVTWASTLTPELDKTYVFDGRVYDVIGWGNAFGTTGPTHTSGTALNGNVTLKFLGTLPTFSTNLVGTVRTEYINMTKLGSGYTSVPTVTFSNGDQTAVATLDVDRITGLVVTPGTTTSELPTITIGDSWVGNQAYTSGDQVFVEGNLYTAAATGTSGTTAPTHTTGTVSDGGLNWTYAGEAAKAVATNYDGTVSEVTITNTGATATEMPTFSVSLPTSPYVAGTQLQVEGVAGPFTLTDVVLTSGGDGYTADTTTITLEDRVGAGTGAVITPSFLAGAITLKVGDGLVNHRNRARAKIVRTDGSSFAIVDRISGDSTVNGSNFLAGDKIEVNSTQVLLVDRVSTSSVAATITNKSEPFHEPFSSTALNAAEDSDLNNYFPKSEKTPNSSRDTSVFGIQESGPNNVSQERWTAEVIQRPEITESFLKGKLDENNENLTKIDEDAEKLDAQYETLTVGTSPNEKIKKYGPVNRWRDIPRSTATLKVTPNKWDADNRTHVDRNFTISLVFETPTNSGGPCPPPGPCNPCCPAVPPSGYSFSFKKTFVNNFSYTAERWVNIVNTYNGNSANADWSFL